MHPSCGLWLWGRSVPLVFRKLRKKKSLQALTLNYQKRNFHLIPLFVRGNIVLESTHLNTRIPCKKKIALVLVKLMEIGKRYFDELFCDKTNLALKKPKRTTKNFKQHTHTNGTREWTVCVQRQTSTALLSVAQLKIQRRRVSCYRRPGQSPRSNDTKRTTSSSSTCTKTMAPPIVNSERAPRNVLCSTATRASSSITRYCSWGARPEMLTISQVCVVHCCVGLDWIVADGP